MTILSAIPRWVIVLFVIALVVFLGDKLGIFHIHFNIGGGLAL